MKKKPKKSKHLFVKPETHKKVKDMANSLGKKLMPFVDELLDWAVNYKKFLSAESTTDITK